MEITAAQAKDFAEITALARQVHDLHVQMRPDIFTNLDCPMLWEAFEMHLNNKEILVLRDSGQIINYAVFHVLEKTAPDGTIQKRLWVDVLCTRENARGLGAGQLMLRHLQQYGKENNCTRMALTVACENETAIAFYEKAGMRRENIRYSMPL